MCVLHTKKIYRWKHLQLKEKSENTDGIIQ